MAIPTGNRPIEWIRFLRDGGAHGFKFQQDSLDIGPQDKLQIKYRWIRGTTISAVCGDRSTLRLGITISTTGTQVNCFNDADPEASSQKQIVVPDGYLEQPLIYTIDRATGAFSFGDYSVTTTNPAQPVTSEYMGIGMTANASSGNQFANGDFYWARVLDASGAVKGVVVPFLRASGGIAYELLTGTAYTFGGVADTQSVIYGLMPKVRIADSERYRAISAL